MNVATVRRRAKKRLDALSAERLRIADDFLAYLEERESAEATEELLRIPGFSETLRQAEEEVQAGRLTSVERLRRKT